MGVLALGLAVATSDDQGGDELADPFQFPWQWADLGPQFSSFSPSEVSGVG